MRDFNFSQTPDYKGFVQRDLNSCLIAFSTLFAGLRLYTRAFVTKAAGWDDILAACSWVALVIFSALELRALGYGSGAHQANIPPEYLGLFFASLTTQTLYYFWVVGLVRLTIVALLLRLSKDVAYIYVKLAYVIGATILIQTLVCFLIRLLECQYISDLWKPPGFTRGECMPQPVEARMMFAHSGIGIAIDIALLALPIWVVVQNMMLSAKMIRIILIFCVGFFAVVTGIVRLVLISNTDFSTDTTYKMSVVAFWTDIEPHVGLWCACFPAVYPLYIMSCKRGMGSKMKSYGAKLGWSQAISTSSNSAQHNRPKARYVRNGGSIDPVESDHDAGSSRGIISEAPTNMQMDDLEAGKIYKTTEVRVHVDDGSSDQDDGKKQKGWTAM